LFLAVEEMILPLVSCDKSMTYNDQTAASPSLISGGGYFPRTRLRLFRQQASKGIKSLLKCY